MENRQAFNEAVDCLKGRIETPYHQVVISHTRSLPEIVSGFILTQLGVVKSWEDLTHPLVWYTRRVDESLKDRSLELFDQKTQNPAVLRALVDQSQIEGSPRRALWELTNLMEHYASYPGQRWVEAREHIAERGREEQLYLHDFISTVMDANSDNPASAFSHGVSGLRRQFLRRCLNKAWLVNQSIKLVVPVIKSQADDPDQLEDSSFYFDPHNILYLPQTTLFVGGFPNVGKSTLAASLCFQMQQLLRECQDRGIVGEEKNIGLVDLDLATPTSQAILEDKEASRHSETEWTPDMAKKAHQLLESASTEQTISIADLPGQPTQYTEIIANHPGYSIIVTRSAEYQNEKEWREFFTKFPRQANMVKIFTRLEENRSSGLRIYKSVSRGDNENRLIGRLVNLRRRIVQDDPF